MKYISIKDYASKHNISVQSVYKKIDTQKLFSTLINKKKHIVIFDDSKVAVLEAELQKNINIANTATRDLNLLKRKYKALQEQKKEVKIIKEEMNIYLFFALGFLGIALLVSVFFNVHK